MKSGVTLLDCEGQTYRPTFIHCSLSMRSPTEVAYLMLLLQTLVSNVSKC